MGKRRLFGKKTVVPTKRTFAQKAVPAVTETAAKAVPALIAAKAVAGPALADARDKATPYLADARDKATPYLTDARDRATPYLTDARDKAAPVLSDVIDRLSSDVLPVLSSAIAALDTATEDARSEAKVRGAKVAAALKGEPPAPVKRKRRISNLLISLGLGGVAFAVTKKLTEKKEATTGWQSAYTPASTTASVPTQSTGTTTTGMTTTTTGAAGSGPVGGTHRADSTTGVAHDSAASDPAEAAADSTDVPHVNSTPDNPVSSVDVDPDNRPRGL